MTFYKKGPLLVLNREEDNEDSKSFDLMENGHCLNGNRRQKVPKIEKWLQYFGNLFYLMIERRRGGDDIPLTRPYNKGISGGTLKRKPMLYEKSFKNWLKL